MPVIKTEVHNELKKKFRELVIRKGETEAALLRRAVMKYIEKEDATTVQK